MNVTSRALDIIITQIFMLFIIKNNSMDPIFFTVYQLEPSACII